MHYTTLGKTNLRVSVAGLGTGGFSRLGLKSGDKMIFTMLSDGTVVMRPKTRRLADLAGSLTRPGQPKVAIADMNPFKARAATKTVKRRAP